MILDAPGDRITGDLDPRTPEAKSGPEHGVEPIGAHHTRRLRVVKIREGDESRHKVVRNGELPLSPGDGPQVFVTAEPEQGRYKSHEIRIIRSGRPHSQEGDHVPAPPRSTKTAS